MGSSFTFPGKGAKEERVNKTGAKIIEKPEGD